MNTWGIYSINNSTFNTKAVRQAVYPKSARDVIYTALKLNNATLNILGYLDKTSCISGPLRMGIGAVTVLTTLAIGDPQAPVGAIIGPYFWEALGTGFSQMARGALETFIPHGKVINLALDLGATPWNMLRSFLWDIEGSDVAPDCFGHVNRAMPPPDFPTLLQPLHLV